MAKIAYNACYGGFGLSDEGVKRYAEIKGLTLYPETKQRFGGLLGVTEYWLVPADQRPVQGDWKQMTREERTAYNAALTAARLYPDEIARNDPALIQVIEEMGEEANGGCAYLAIKEIPDGSQYRIDEYDGNESVMLISDYEWQVA